MIPPPVDKHNYTPDMGHRFMPVFASAHKLLKLFHLSVGGR